MVNSDKNYWPSITSTHSLLFFIFEYRLQENKHIAIYITLNKIIECLQIHLIKYKRQTVYKLQVKHISDENAYSDRSIKTRWWSYFNLFLYIWQKKKQLFFIIKIRIFVILKRKFWKILSGTNLLKICKKNRKNNIYKLKKYE